MLGCSLLLFIYSQHFLSQSTFSFGRFKTLISPLFASSFNSNRMIDEQIRIKLLVSHFPTNAAPHWVSLDGDLSVIFCYGRKAGLIVLWHWNSDIQIEWICCWLSAHKIGLRSRTRVSWMSAMKIELPMNDYFPPLTATLLSKYTVAAFNLPWSA